MIFEFIPVAEASLETLMKNINKVIINPIIFFLFALAMVYFLYGVAKYLLNPENEDVRKTSKSQMLYGLVGLFVMVGVFGIMNFILNTVGETRRIKIQPTGDYEINNDGQRYSMDGESESDLINNYIPTEVDINSTTGNELGTGVNLTKFDKSPFIMNYVSNPLCWRKELSFNSDTEYKAIKGVKDLAVATYLKDNNLTKAPANTTYPINFGILTTYDSVNKVYYAWIDARAPKGDNSPNVCVLKTSTTREFALQDYVLGEPFSSPKYASDGSSIFTNHYISDNLFVRIVASGVDTLLQTARDIAIKNAFALLGIEIQDINTMTVVYPTARILEEKYIVNPVTGNYEYWVAVESEKISNVVYGSTKESPFTNKYEDDSFFIKLVNYATSTDATKARELAINNALLELSKKIDPNDVSKGVQLMIILEEKQIFNEKTGEYEYWVAIEGSNQVAGSNPVNESAKTAPFTKVYKTDNSSYKVISSGVDKDLSKAKSLAFSNALIKLKKEIGDKMTGSKVVNIIEEKETFNSLTKNYEYWVALGVSK